MKIVRQLIVLVITGTIYMGMIVLTALLWIYLYGYASGNWGFWEYTISIPFVIPLVIISLVSCLAYVSFVLIYLYRERQRHKRESGKKNSYIEFGE